MGQRHEEAMMLLAQDRLVEWDERDEDACMEAARKNEEDLARWQRNPTRDRDGHFEPPPQRGPVFKTRRGRLIAISYSAPSSDRIKAGFGALVIAEDDGAFIEMAPTRLRHVSSVPVTPKPAPTSIPGPGIPRG